MVSRLNRKILVTGGTGYVGTAIVPKLARKYPVRVYCSMHFGNAISWVPNVEFVKGDIRDAIALRQALVGVTDVIHLAAIVTDELAAMNPSLAKDINIGGMETLLKRYASLSGEVFEAPQRGKFVRVIGLRKQSVAWEDIPKDVQKMLSRDGMAA